MQDSIDILLLSQFTDRVTFLTSLIAYTDFRIYKLVAIPMELKLVLEIGPVESKPILSPHLLAIVRLRLHVKKTVE